MQFYLDLCLICWLTSLQALFICTSSNVTSIVSITHTVIFSKQDVSRRRVAHGSPGENKCSWNSGKIKQLKVKFLFKVFCLKQPRNTLFFWKWWKIADTSFKENIFSFSVHVNKTSLCLELYLQKKNQF